MYRAWRDRENMAANRELAIRWSEEVWNRGRVEVVEELAHPDAVCHDLEGPWVTTRDLEGFRSFHA